MKNIYRRNRKVYAHNPETKVYAHNPDPVVTETTDPTDVTTQGDLPPGLFQRSTVGKATNLTADEQKLYSIQISKARREWRENMPNTYKSKRNQRKRNKFVKEYMSKFSPPAYQAKVEKTEVNQPVTSEVNPPTREELSQLFYGAKSDPELLTRERKGSDFSLSSDFEKTALTSDRFSEIENYIRTIGYGPNIQ